MNPKVRFKNNDGSSFGDYSSVAIGSLFSKIKAGGTPKSSCKEYYNGDIKFLSISDMTRTGKYVEKTEKNITEDGISNSSAWIVPKGSVLLSMYASYGKVCINNDEMATSQAILAMVPENNNAEYLYQLLCYLDESGFWDSYVKSGTQPNLSKGVVEKVRVFVPELGEQQKIASFFTALDKKIEINKKILSRYRAIQKEFIDNSLRSINITDLKNEYLENIVNFVKDYDHYMPPSVKDGVPYVMTSDFVGQDNEIDFEGCKKISFESYFKLSKKFKIAVGDIIFARYATVGAVRVVEEGTKFIVSYSCAVIRPDDSKVIPKYLYYYIKSKKCQKDIERSINAGTQKNVGIATIKKLSIEVPSLAEQEKIVSILSQLDQKITLLKQKDETLTKLKKTFMQQMFV